MKVICSPYNALPVKIENKEQDDALKRLNWWGSSLIGLHIPEGQPWGENNFRWISDGSKPNYTNWYKLQNEPNNIEGNEVFVITYKATNMGWWDIRHGRNPNVIICMADTHLGVDH
uniref:C-type lectin domain-containing protein n=1 Tax=Steinernema glaseri TaxID=37863 RepID=A0A1I7YH06_9BILA